MSFFSKSFSSPGQLRPFVLSSVVFVATLGGYYILFGERHRRSRRRLEKELSEAIERVEELQLKLDEKREEEENEENKNSDKKEVRVFMDGVFDIFHYGHMNAFRQGHALGTFLLVGINSSESVERCKGSLPVMSDEEREMTVKGCKWVDEIIPKSPYIMTEEYLDYLFKEHNVDFVVHGDDPCLVNGKDVYEQAKKLGKYKSIPRTEGISTTEVVGRMLLLNKDHHDQPSNEKKDINAQLTSRQRTSSATNVFKRNSRFLTTGRMIRLFSAGHKEAPKNAKIVYMDGVFDMLHAGHVASIAKAKALGDYLIIGVYNDAIANACLGKNLPIFNLNERVLSILGCKNVDDVLIDSPWQITADMIASLNISLVVRGTHKMPGPATDESRYDVPKQMGIFVEIPSDSNLSVVNIIERIQINEEKYRKKFETKVKLEDQYYENRYKPVLESIKKETK
eukprot:c20839_g1_i1.p2 GENE.c20839_g1_i1~~c20839_g1_i1.p2  ORF type:complete len:464 (-),score=227.77 c20839_g1_i1:2271-3629(-)